jgi:hypothetical protein
MTKIRVKRSRFEPPLSEIKDNDALQSIWSALEGKPGSLASRLRDGNASPEERKIAAYLIEGKIKPRHPRRGSSRHQHLFVANFVAWLRRVSPTMSRENVLNFARQHFKDTHGWEPSERYVRYAIDEFDEGALAHSKRMYKDTFERQENTELDLEQKKRIREELKDADRDFLIEAILGFLAQE